MSELAASAERAPLVRQVCALVAWAGTGRKLTQTGQITLADARHLVDELGTGDTIDPKIGDRVFRTKSSAELGHLSAIVAWAKAARLVRVTGGKLVPVKKNAALLNRPLDLAVALLTVYPKLGEPLFPRGYWRQSLVGDCFTQVGDMILRVLFASDGPCPLRLPQTMAQEMFAAQYDLDDLSDQQLDMLRRTVDTDVTTAVTALESLGAATVGHESSTAELTPLGRFAIGRLRGVPLPGEAVWQVRITLTDVSAPVVWRRALIPPGISLGRLHHLLQWLMGWQDCHMHAFRIGELEYGTDPEGELGFRDETEVRLADVAKVGDRIGYEYDFGDGWQHELAIEAETKAREGRTYPVCLDGEGACPPEDCGGYPGYEELKEILADPSHEEYDDTKAWADGQTDSDFDPNRFDLARTNMLIALA